MTALDHLLGNAIAIACCKCGLNFSVPVVWEKDRREKHDTFYCPNGHQLAFTGPTEADRLKRQLAAKEEELQRARGRADVAERRRRAAKGQLTKVKRRVANGVCPCCNRYFEQLHRHMTTVHPGFEAVEELPTTKSGAGV